MLVDPVGSIAR